MVKDKSQGTPSLPRPQSSRSHPDQQRHTDHHQESADVGADVDGVFHSGLAVEYNYGSADAHSLQSVDRPRSCHSQKGSRLFAVLPLSWQLASDASSAFSY